MFYIPWVLIEKYNPKTFSFLNALGLWGTCNTSVLYFFTEQYFKPTQGILAEESRINYSSLNFSMKFRLQSRESQGFSMI